MAVVEFKRSDLENLVGKKLDETVLKKIPMLGVPLEKITEDTVQYEIFPDRPDMLSIEGFARAVSSFLGMKKPVKYRAKKETIKLFVNPSVRIVRPYVTAAVVRNITITDELITSLMQVQEKIHETFGRKRKKVAIGVHDLDKVTPPLEYRAVEPESITFRPLDMPGDMNLRDVAEKHPKGVEYGHIVKESRRWPVIIDKNKSLLSFPPVINGELTRVTKNTRNLFIDVTGTSQKSIDHALNIIVTALADRGGTIEYVDVDDKLKPDLKEKKVKLDVNYINKILGVTLTKKQIVKLLERMNIGYSGSSALIPPYRTDVMHPIDIAEDVAIAYGYNKFEPALPKMTTHAKELDIHVFVDHVRDIMIGLGFQEVVNMILSNGREQFEKMNTHKSTLAETLNPLTAEYNLCRKKLLPSILKTFSQNKHVDYPQKIFEVGEIILVDEDKETCVDCRKKLAAAISDSTINYEEVTSIADALMSSFGIRYELKECDSMSFITGRVAHIDVGEKTMGILGEIHPQVLENWAIEKPIIVFEMDLTAIHEMIQK